MRSHVRKPARLKTTSSGEKSVYDLVEDSHLNCVFCEEHKVKKTHLRCPKCLELFIEDILIPYKLKIRELEKQLQKK